MPSIPQRVAPRDQGVRSWPAKARRRRPRAAGSARRPSTGDRCHPSFAIDTHGRCAGHSTRVQGYGVSGGGAGPRRVLPGFRRARHLDRPVAPKSKFLSPPGGNHVGSSPGEGHSVDQGGERPPRGPSWRADDRGFRKLLPEFCTASPIWDPTCVLGAGIGTVVHVLSSVVQGFLCTTWC
jgi:hypothetical protein